MSTVDGVFSGNARALARAITVVEDGGRERDDLIRSLRGRTGNAILVGVTGPPGSGKSTLVDRLIERELRQNREVAVLAVDPTSPFSGGALLGDRLRMQEHAENPRVFIRSMASRGHLGGISSATGDAIKVLDAAGYDTVMIETTGVGQTEIEIVKFADIVLLVLVPGMGDEIQAMKAGVMEIADIFVVNKKDLDGAERLKTEIGFVLGMKPQNGGREENPVLMVSGTRDEGIDELAREISGFLTRADKSGLLVRKRKDRIAQELRNTVMDRVHEYVEEKAVLSQKLAEWTERVYEGQTDASTLVESELSDLFRRQ